MSYESDDKMVSHPSHYNSGKYEVIDIIEEFTKDLSGIEAVDTGNAIKYVLRWNKKNGIQDLKKAIWYLTHLVEHLESRCQGCIDANSSINANESCEGCDFIKKPKPEDRRCETCKFKRSPCDEDPCHTCFSNAKKGNEYSLWKSKDTESDDANDMDQEESDLSVSISKSSSGVYMPDGKPWQKTCTHCNGV